MRCDEIPETNSKTCPPAPVWATTCNRAETFPSVAAMMLADGDPAVAIWRETAEPECSKCDWGGCYAPPIVVFGRYVETVVGGLCSRGVLR